MSSPRKRGPITTAYRGDAGTRSSRAIQLLFLSFRGAPLRANPESISPTPRWIPGSRNARPGMTADSIAQMAATFRDGDTHPRVLKRAYVRHVLVVRGASRGRFEAEQDAAPARVSRTHASGRLGSPSGPTMWLCRSPAGRGADEGGESRPDQGSSNLPHPHPEVRSPRPKTPQRMFAAALAARESARCVLRRRRPRSRATLVERRKAMRSFVRGLRKRRTIGRRQPCCAWRRSISPHSTEGQTQSSPRADVARERLAWAQEFLRWLFENRIGSTSLVAERTRISNVIAGPDCRGTVPNPSRSPGQAR